jgi:hypothetical protein
MIEVKEKRKFNWIILAILVVVIIVWALFNFKIL